MDKSNDRKKHIVNAFKKVGTIIGILCVLYMTLGRGFLNPQKAAVDPDGFLGRFLNLQKTVVDPDGFVEIMEAKGFSIVENPEAYGSLAPTVAYLATAPLGEYELAYVMAETDNDALRIFDIYSMQIEERKWEPSHVVSESPLGNYISKSQKINESYWRADCVDNVTIVVDGSNSEYGKEIDEIYSQLIQ